MIISVLQFFTFTPMPAIAHGMSVSGQHLFIERTCW